MKKISCIFSIFLIAILNASAQPNGGFENWNQVLNYQTPDSWQTLNFLSALYPSNPVSAFKATALDKHSGNYALNLKTVYIHNNPAPEIIYDTIGLTFTGKINLSPPSYMYGFPYTGRPEKLKFWSKYIPVGNDKGGARALLQKWNGTSRDTIAAGEITIEAIAAYTFFEINLTYYSTALPDTAAIVFAASRKSDEGRIGSSLYIDDVAFTGWVGIDEQDIYADKIKIFPNPATDAINIFAEIDEANNVQVFSPSGTSIGKYEIHQYSAKINTGLLAEGIYFYQLHDKKNRILTRGKFNIIK